MVTLFLCVLVAVVIGIILMFKGGSSSSFEGIALISVGFLCVGLGIILGIAGGVWWFWFT